MDVFYVYTYSSAGWLALQAAPLLLFPSLIITLLSNEVRKPTSKAAPLPKSLQHFRRHIRNDPCSSVLALETYFCRSLALSFLALALLTILLTGSIPLTASIAESAADATEPEDPKAPYAVPTITLSTIFHSVCAVYSYVYYASPLTSNTGFLLGVVGYGSLAAIGGWCLLFGSEKGRMKRGGDKRVSGWPFRNVESERKKGKKRL